ALPWNNDSNGASVVRVAAELNWLTRDRRIRMGSRLAKLCEDAKDGNAHDFAHYLRASRIAFHFVATDAPRAERLEYLNALTLITQARFNARKVVGVATEPVGSGRSYDVVLRLGELSRSSRELILKTNPLSRAAPCDPEE